LKEKDIALITTSRLTIKNGIGDVIKALPKLPENIKFIIFGEGELESELKKLARNLGLSTETAVVSDRVIFKGFVPHAEMPKYLKACDIFIRASLSEGFGNSFIEAMACKMPVIATPVGGIVDFLKENGTGYFCEPQNPESIIKAVEKVISDPNKNQIIENAYNMVKEKYDWNLITKQITEVFNKIL
jgi:glycosyltransferase involved in cell wall biosynthesis